MTRKRRLKSIGSDWKKTKRRLTVSINGKKVKKLVPVKVKKVNGKYKIRKLHKRKRGPKPQKKKKKPSTHSWA